MFGKRLAALRKERGLSQYELADRLGFSRGQIANYEQGQREPDYKTLKIFADYFDVSTDYLLGRSDVLKEEKAYYTLTEKDERDIAKDLERIMSDLDSDNSLAYHGEPMDEETRRLVSIAIENSMRMAREMAKKKFTPKKYRNNDEKTE